MVYYYKRFMMDDLGVPQFQETPTWLCVNIPCPFVNFNEQSRLKELHPVFWLVVCDPCPNMVCINRTKYTLYLYVIYIYMVYMRRLCDSVWMHALSLLHYCAIVFGYTYFYSTIVRVCHRITAWFSVKFCWWIKVL